MALVRMAAEYWLRHWPMALRYLVTVYPLLVLALDPLHSRQSWQTLTATATSKKTL
jgi:hypothetical protein